MSVFTEILLVAKSGNGGKDQSPGEDDQAYLLSLATCISQCPDVQWKSLSDEAKKWYDEAVRSSNGTLPIPEPEGFNKEEELVFTVSTGTAPAGNGAATTTYTTPEKKVAIVKSIESGRIQSQSSSPKHDIPAVKTIDQIGQIKTTTERKQKDSGVLDAIRKTVILHLDWTSKQVHQYLTENGYPNANANVVAVNAGDIRRVVACVKDLGHWKD